MHVDPNEILPPGRSRETRIRRDARGGWWNGDEAITHPMLVRAFDSWIERTDQGRYVLKNDINWAYITVDGAPIDVRSVRLDAARCTLVLSDGREELLAPHTLREGPDGALYCDVRDGTMPARFDAHAAVQLGDAMIGEEPPTLVIGGERITPKVTERPLERMP